MHAAAWLLWSLAASPWSPARWRIDLEITFNPNSEESSRSSSDGTTTSAEDTSTGGRLVLPTIVSIDSEKALAENDNTNTGKCNRLTILQNPTYVTMDLGEQSVVLRPDGGWRISTRRSSNKGAAGQLFLWMDVLSAAQRHSVRLEANQRLYLTANCWRSSELAYGLKQFEPILRDYEAAQRDLELRLSHESGDRRLDGTDLIDTALGSVNMAILVRKRDECRQEIAQAELTLPNRKKVSPAGHWPGSDEPLTISNGLIIGQSLQPRGWFGLGGAQETVLGKWRAVPMREKDEKNL